MSLAYSLWAQVGVSLRSVIWCEGLVWKYPHAKSRHVFLWMGHSLTNSGAIHCSHPNVLQGVFVPESECGHLNLSVKLVTTETWKSSNSAFLHLENSWEFTRSSRCDFWGRKPCVVLVCKKTGQTWVLTQVSLVALSNSFGLLFVWCPTCKLG